MVKKLKKLLNKIILYDDIQKSLTKLNTDIESIKHSLNILSIDIESIKNKNIYLDRYENKDFEIKEINKLISEKIKTNHPVKLHIGCGTKYKNGWINIDNNSDINIGKLDFNWDLLKRLPLPASSVDFIFHEHFIEHLTYDQGQLFFMNCSSILKSGGVMRIACPDLDAVITSYINDNWREQDWVEKYGYQWIRSRGEMVNICLNNNPWGHQFVYSKEDLIRSLIDAGFQKNKISEVNFSESKYNDLQNLETRKDSIIFEVTKE